jgi:hypothetical protein
MASIAPALRLPALGQAVSAQERPQRGQQSGIDRGDEGQRQPAVTRGGDEEEHARPIEIVHGSTTARARTVVAMS